MKKLLLVLAVIAVVTSSCRFGWGKRVSGSGNIKTEEHSVSGFKNIQLSGGMNIYLTQGDFKPVKIETDDNLLQYIEVIQQGNDLVVREKPGFNPQPSHEIRVYVTAPVFNRIQVSGAGDISAESQIVNTEDMEVQVSGAGDVKLDLKAPSVKIDLSGAGSINLKGETKNVSVGLSGAGSAHCFDLLAENAKVRVSGVGNAEVFASVALDAHVSGVGDVRYKGGATNVSQQVSGVGSIKKAD